MTMRVERMTPPGQKIIELSGVGSEQIGIREWIQRKQRHPENTYRLTKDGMVLFST